MRPALQHHLDVGRRWQIKSTTIQAFQVAMNLFARTMRIDGGESLPADPLGAVGARHTPKGTATPLNVAPADDTFVPAVRQDDSLWHWHVHELLRHTRLAEHGAPREVSMIWSTVCRCTRSCGPAGRWVVPDLRRVVHLVHTLPVRCCAQTRPGPQRSTAARVATTSAVVAACAAEQLQNWAVR